MGCLYAPQPIVSFMYRMQIPSNILLSKLRPSRYLPLLEVIWCIITFSMACVRSVYAVYCLRLMLGLAEAGFLPGIMFLIGTWYTKKEMGKRAALITIFGSLGAGLSGLVQAVLLKTVDGVLGISGFVNEENISHFRFQLLNLTGLLAHSWRWMFVVDATFTLALAIFGYKNMPDYPHNTRWLSEKVIVGPPSCEVNTPEIINSRMYRSVALPYIG